MKKKQNISFRLVAYTDAAGKYSPEAYRSGNEDNFFVNDDFIDTTTCKVSQDEVLQLGELGMLMAVADGMGGMNAGEVASQIAIDTVKKAFNKTSLSESVIATSQSRKKYLETVIKQADKNIKTEARKDSSREGMGSTIILAWLFNDELTISWCGDSRVYIFNDRSGIRLISQDHSYVQELVNKGLLTYDQTFDHPQNNILTRSLGDPTKDAKPESKTLKVGKGDIILLCSDGLSGVLRDRKTYDINGQLLPEENIEDIIRTHTSSMKECREALWEAAERGGWYDNVTAILCQITDGPESFWEITPITSNESIGNRKKKIGIYIILGIMIFAAIIAAFFVGKGSQSWHNDDKVSKEDIVIGNIDSRAAENDSTIAESLTIGTKDKEPSESTVSSINNHGIINRIKEQTQELPEEDDKDEILTPISKNKEREKDKEEVNELTPIESL